MRFLADECIWRSVVDAIRASGFAIDWIHDLSPSISDEDVLDFSKSRDFILLTEDSDFGDLIFRQGHSAYGVVRIRLSLFEGTKTEIAAAVALRIATLGDRLIGQFTTIEPARTRHRVLSVGKNDRN